jgi:hypothetical protein
METLSIRYEQKRGHFMIVERNPPLSRDELNETQLQMLKQCDIPGLLPLETQQCDGQLSLRYTLTGSRMLSEAMRASHWSMADMMGALCRLAEVLEECRLYLLDADRIRLQDEFIFMGDDWQDLRFTYLPIDMPTLHRADDLERLIVRWMMKVKEPDGSVMQQVLRLVATTGFVPMLLSRYARQYLTRTVDSQDGVQSHSRTPSQSAMLIVSTPKNREAEPMLTPAKASFSWNILQPPSGDPHHISDMWGDDYNASSSLVTEPDGDSMDSSRLRIVAVCIAVLLTTVAWKFIYLSEPNEQKLLFSICVTLAASAGVTYVWNGLPEWGTRRKRDQVHVDVLDKRELHAEAEEDVETENERGSVQPRFINHFGRQSNPTPPASTHSNTKESDPDNKFSAETTWLTSPQDQTTLLDQKNTSQAADYYLIWESKGIDSRIPLQGNSLVIGRSTEASQHVDETMGISRAHVELVRVTEHWNVKDLGSRNGSKLNDKPMVPYELYSLQSGDCLSLGKSEYTFHQDSKKRSSSG